VFVIGLHVNNNCSLEGYYGAVSSGCRPVVRPGHSANYPSSHATLGLSVAEGCSTFAWHKTSVKYRASLCRIVSFREGVNELFLIQ